MSDQPIFTIRIAAQLVGVHQQTLRAYEREGLVFPARSAGRQRLYSQADIDRLCEIRRLINELGVNLPGADIILRQREELRALRAENEQLRDELSQRPPIIPRRLRQRP